MIGYITIGSLDTARSKTFYDAVLAVVGWRPFADYGDYIGYGPDGRTPARPSGSANRSTASRHGPATAS
jgi:catechol 2,3-dioxygenase-like lactoylglutathione lyase family enzyme